MRKVPTLRDGGHGGRGGARGDSVGDRNLGDAGRPPDSVREVRGHGGGLYKLNPVDPYLETAWFGDSSLEPCNVISWFQILLFQIQLVVPLRHGARGGGGGPHVQRGARRAPGTRC